MNRHGRGGDYVPTLPEHGQSDNLLVQASSMLCNATSFFCEGSGCGGSSFHEEDEVDKVPGLLDRSPHLDEEDSDENDQNDYSTLQQDLADFHLESQATPGREETSPDDLSPDALLYMLGFFYRIYSPGEEERRG